jgi:hypothetical protein
VNGSDSTLTDIDGSTDVGPYSYKDGVTLTSGQLATLLDGSTFGQKNVCAFADLTGDTAAQQKKRSAALAAMYLSA